MDFTDDPQLIMDKKELKFTPLEEQLVKEELGKLLHKGVIQKVTAEPGQILSNVFLREKKDGSQRLILNLKNLNQKVDKIHFKMDSLKQAIALIKQDCFFASIDLKDAYYSVNLAPSVRKFFRFEFEGTIFEFVGLPQGFRDSPRIFTKLLKPALSYLRCQGHTVLIYIDDSLLQGDSFLECSEAVRTACELLDSLGFTIHPTKSVLQPSQSIEFLGFILDSHNMTVSLTSAKAEKIRKACADLVKRQRCTIRQLAEVIGQFVAAQAGVWVAPLYYKRLEIAKTAALSCADNRFEAMMALGPDIKDDLQWWIDNVQKFPAPVNRGLPVVTVKSDASKNGWGAECNGDTTGGMWTNVEAQSHINCLELKAALFALKVFCREMSDSHIQLMTDNSTTVACINHLGSTKTECNDIARNIWFWCLAKNNFVTATHLPGCENVEADLESRMDRHQIEWQLDPEVFQAISKVLGGCDIDLFASRVNAQLEKYVSWKADPSAFAVDAFSLDWTKFRAFCFPPFSLLPRFLQRLEVLEADCVLVAPLWTTQSWFTKMLRLLIDHPVLLPARDNLLTHPLTGAHHPILKKTKLVACLLSGKRWKTQAYMQKLPTLSCRRGETVPKGATRLISSDGWTTVLNKKRILFSPLQMT